MKALVIRLDSDGILSDFVTGALRIVFEVTGKKFTPADWNEFNFTKALKLTPEEGSTVKKVIASRRGFAASLQPYPEARQGVRRLRTLGHVSCVTSPWDSSPYWRTERSSWLALHFGIDEVHHDDDKSAYEGDVFVDDRVKHVAAWLAAWPGRCAVLWRTPHNRNEILPPGAHETDSWDRLYEIAKAEAERLPSIEEALEPPVKEFNVVVEDWRKSIASAVGCETTDIKTVQELLACEPPSACENGENCWTHSEWVRCSNCEALADGLHSLCTECRGLE